MEQTSLVREVWWNWQVHVIIEEEKKRGTHPNNTNSHLPSFLSTFLFYFGCTNYIIYVHYISDNLVSLYHIYSSYKTIRFFKGVWHESMDKCDAMEYKEKSHSFFCRPLFSLYTFSCTLIKLTVNSRLLLVSHFLDWFWIYLWFF